MIYAGKLTETLKVYEVNETQTASGFKSEERTFKFTCKAQRLKNKENYVVDGEELFHIAEPTFRLRSRKLSDTDIIEHKGEWFRIISIDDYRTDMTIKLQKINL